MYLTINIMDCSWCNDILGNWIIFITQYLKWKGIQMPSSPATYSPTQPITKNSKWLSTKPTTPLLATHLLQILNTLETTLTCNSKYILKQSQYKTTGSQQPVPSEYHKQRCTLKLWLLRPYHTIWMPIKAHVLAMMVIPT